VNPPHSLRTKVFRTLLLVTAFIGVATASIVAVTIMRSSAAHLARVQRSIEEGITSKGRVLTENHALALRDLTLDNAFLDMQRLVDRATQEDEDVVYGLYVNAAHETLAFSRHGDDKALAHAPERNAWQILQIPKPDLLVKATRVQRTARLGEDLLEVSAPVLGDDHELLGTVRYGLSTRRMKEAHEQAIAEARAELTTSVLWVLSLVALVALFASFVSRMLAVRITKPVAELTAAARDLASGNRLVRVTIESGDELEQLGASFNHMVADLDASYRNLEELNCTLEQKVRERTQELARRNQDMRLVLDNVDEGLLTITADGTVAPERSRVVDHWFGPCAERKPFVEYISQTARGFGLEFELAWEQLADNVLPLELALEQMPRQLVAGSRSWRFRYLPILRDDRLEGLLVVVQEVTEELARQREEDEQSELLQGFKRLMLDRSGFGRFLREADRMVGELRSRALESDPVLFRRTLHTLKGNSASMGLVVLARLCHGLEQQLEDDGRVTDEALEELSTRWHTVTDHIQSFAGGSLQRTIEVSESDYVALVSRISTGIELEEVQRELLTWQLEPVTRPLQRLADQAKALARQLDKGEIEVAIQGNGVRLDPDAFGPLFSVLVHLIRNAVDHGLESPAEREALKKPHRGTVILKAEATEDTLVFEISDDGRGIDWNTVAKKAKSLGLPHATPQDLTEALYCDGFSTKADPTIVSGRGVGLGAVRSRVLAMDGSLEVRSVRGVGTSWILRLPWAPPGAAKERAWKVTANGRLRSLIPSA